MSDGTTDTPNRARSHGVHGAIPVVSFSQVSVVREGRRILDAIDWEVRATDRWVVLGPNGSGKTTLLQVAGARLMPSRGSVTIVGERVGASDLRVVRTRVSLVSAATVRSLRPFLTAREVVVTGRDAALFPLPGRYTEADWAEADRNLERLMGTGTGTAPGQESGTGPGPPAHTPFGVLSEGERSRVLLARSLMGRAELILLDEPAAGLDLGARERLLTRLGDLAADDDVPPVVLVTHHLEEIPPGFTHALLLADGRLVAAGELEAVLTASLVSECFGVRVRVERRDARWWAFAAV
ncbi:MAG: ABC transporter ATP-binding protein [Acidimicrobiales bacterium]